MKTLKVYLAAPYKEKDFIAVCAEELRAGGIEVTSSWLHEPHAPNIGMADLTAEDHRKYAIQDVKDVKAADILVFWTDPTKTIIRAGRHVEFGIAIGLGLSRPMPIFVVGKECENIFHYMPQVIHFESWEKIRDFLIKMAASNQ